jgi:energy-coupling factor transporter ATP-binding protein EcfA2
MAMVTQLRRQNQICLHASAVVIDGRMVAILGQKGAGKSTSAAAFARAGYPIAADDVVVVAESDGRFIAEPAYPNLRLWPSSVEALFGHADALPQLTPSWEKRALDLTQAGYRYQREPLPVAGLYILGDRSSAGSAPFIKPVRGADALMKVVSNSWGMYSKPVMLGPQLQLAGRLSSCVPVRELVPHENPQRLPGLCELLVEDVLAGRCD